MVYRSTEEVFLETIPYDIHQVWKGNPKYLLLGYKSGCTSQQKCEQVWRCVTGLEDKAGFDNKNLREAFSLLKPNLLSM